jgi:DNA repair photolyase
MRTLHEAGIPGRRAGRAGDPQLNDRHSEAILEAAAQAGAASAGWIMLRLPLEIAPQFRAWLDEHFPVARRAHHEPRPQNCAADAIRQHLRRAHRGHRRVRRLIEKRFELACKRLGSTGPRRGVRHVAVQAAARERRQGELF